MHDYLLALIGGSLIGLAAVILMAGTGNILGVSGILSRLLPPLMSDWMWRLVFVLGVILAPLLILLFRSTPIPIEITENSGLLIVGGLLVGVGTVTGNGCTSGHGVCGISRFSFRSIVATLVFLASAMLTVFVLQNLLGAN